MKTKMNWTTIYITGRQDFREEVRKKLEHVDLNFMPGYIGNSSQTSADDLYWLDSSTTLRTFKEAIGGKLIWKYRLRFFSGLEEFLDYQESQKKTGLTAEDLSLIEEMRSTNLIQA
jgi:hypothetical protein